MKRALVFCSLIAFSVGARSTPTPIAVELQKAINQVGDSCHQVTQIFHSSTHQRSLIFDVACSGGQTYSVKVNPDGTANVITCRMLMLAAKVSCFVKLDSTARGEIAAQIFSQR